MVRPWNDPLAVMISNFSGVPFSLAHFRASLMAVSFASAPLLQKNAFPNPESSTSLFANSGCCGT